MNDRASQLIVRYYRAVLTLAGLLILGWFAWRSRHAFGEVLAGTQPLRFLLACVLGIVFTIVQGMLFSHLVHKHSRGNAAGPLMAAFLLSQPGKYIPGRIWSTFAQSIALRQSSSLGCLAVANVELAIIGMIQMTALGIACLHPTPIALSVGAFALATLTCVVIMLLPTISWLARGLPGLARWLHLPAIDADRRVPRLREAFALTLLSLATNFAASWSVLLAADASIPAAIRLPLLASLYLGFAAGVLALPVPAGIGVREAATVGLGAMLAPQVPAALLVSVTLLVRCWQLVTDVSCLGLGLLLQARARR